MGENKDFEMTEPVLTFEPFAEEKEEIVVCEETAEVSNVENGELN